VTPQELEISHVMVEMTTCPTGVFFHFTVTITDGVRTHVRSYSFHRISGRFPLYFI